MKKINNEILLGVLEAGDYDRYLVLDNIFYNHEVKVVEDADHYQSMFTSIEKSSVEYGNILKKYSIESTALDFNKICYFLPTLDNDLAHIELLCAILETAVDHNFDVYVAGFASEKNSIKSRLLTELEKNGKIKIVCLEFSHLDVVSFIKWFCNSGISQLIVTSIPTLLVSFIEVFGSKMVTWFSMKFELNCFDKLINRMSFCGNGLFVDAKHGVTWLRNPPAIVGSQLEWKKRVVDNQIVRLISINREEKIRNPIFLEAVKSILKLNLNAQFYWTGRQCDKAIVEYFLANDLSDRTHYIGWVNATQIISEYDIFLDTPNLSGSIAAKAFASGMPVATFENSQSWIDFYKDDISSEMEKLGEKNGVSMLLSEGVDSYVSHVTSLINNKNYYAFISKLEWYLGRVFFNNPSLMQKIHFENLRKIQEKIYEY
ncbi:MAG: hypothetical protein RI902_344 [Pseudomonadota bacterium]|jgi:hypothetical protein